MDEHRPVKAERNRRQRFKERARLEYLAGAEENWRRRTGRPRTAEELERVLRRYPGDIYGSGPGLAICLVRPACPGRPRGPAGVLVEDACKRNEGRR